jgi:hypothetical protein
MDNQAQTLTRVHLEQAPETIVLAAVGSAIAVAPAPITAQTDTDAQAVRA